MDVKHAYSVECAAFQVYNEQIDDLLHEHHRDGAGHNLGIGGGGDVTGLWIPKDSENPWGGKSTYTPKCHVRPYPCERRSTQPI